MGKNGVFYFVVGIILLILIGVITFVAIDKKSSDEIVSDEMFENVESISFGGYGKIIVNKSNAEDVKGLLQSIELGDSEESVNDRMGSIGITISYNDGSQKKIGLTSDLIMIDGKTYSTNKDICQKLYELFK